LISVAQSLKVLKLKACPTGISADPLPAHIRDLKVPKSCPPIVLPTLSGTIEEDSRESFDSKDKTDSVDAPSFAYQQCGKRLLSQFYVPYKNMNDLQH
jgi:hypothetical protein